jgi:hypothetical protein
MESHHYMRRFATVRSENISTGNVMQSNARRPRRFPGKPLLLALLIAFLVPIAARAAIYAFDHGPRSWSEADWSSIGSLPPAAAHPAARVLVLSGRTGGWKGVFSVHSWIVLKREGAKSWSRYDVVGWGNPVRVNGWAPDGRWFGNRPAVVADVTGAKAEVLIPKIEAAISAYQFRNAGDYRIWPGPNSNSFVASVLRAVPELGASLPSNAVGRDFRPQAYAGFSDSHTGVEVNLWGVVGFKLAWVEGVEMNFLGLVAGLDLRHPALKLPGFGRIGTDALAITATAEQSRK